MPPSPRLTVFSLCGLLVAGVGPALAAARKPAPARKAAAAPSAEPKISFETDVRPVLKAYCFTCHGSEEKLEANLDLRLKRFIEKGGDSGHGIVAGNPAKSPLLQRMKSGEMPPVGKKVPPEKIAVVERWIAAGAPTLRTEPAQLPPGLDITPDERAYWFYQPLRRPSEPPLKDARVRTPIDAFVLKKLREKGLAFAPDADRRTLVRRVASDLTGLPPTPEETDAFLKDAGDDAYERMVDHFLASPAYGERWGRHWLDVAGYADSDGNGSDDTPRPYAYKYRDYVIRSLNADKPFDQFIVEQLAGDELVPQPWKNLTPDQIEKLTATGFLRTAVDGTGSDPVATNQVVTDTIKIVSSSLLGLTVGCAQCHDHRYDPIPQSDYYRIRAVFEPALDPAHWRGPGQRLLSLYTDAQRAQAAVVDAEVQKLQAAFNEKQAKFVETAFEVELEKFPADQRDALRAAIKTPDAKRTPEQKLLVANNPKLLISPGVLYQYNQKAADELTADQGRINAKRAEKPAEDFISILTEQPGTVPETHLFYRGDYRAPKQVITPGDLTIAAPEGGRLDIPVKDPNLPTTGRRLAWARNLVSGKHPLFGRVLVNRIWLNHFGRGLVDTPGDFGNLGVKPTHPELLDWLAASFSQPTTASVADRGTTGPSEGVKGKDPISSSPRPSAPPSAAVGGASDSYGCNWSLKKLHRLIMLSTVYRQASTGSTATRKVDSDGSLYSRFPVRRLDAESLRDRILAAAGRLSRNRFGPPVPIVEDNVGQISAQEDMPRRSIYLQVRRSKPVSFLVSFDAPVMTVNCERRISSNSAPQALMLMNSDFMRNQARFFAQRIRNEAPDGLEKQIARAWELAFGRPPEPEESELAVRFVRKQQDPQKGVDPELAALTNLCQQLLSSNEFLYVD